MALDIGPPAVPTLENFHPGPNKAAVEHLRLWLEGPLRSPVPTYLWGDSGSGKTHLLMSVREALRNRGARVGWLDASMHALPEFDDGWTAILMDDVHLYTAAQQHVAFNWFVNALAPKVGEPRAVLAAGLLPPADLRLREDLRSRLGWGHVFALECLDESQRRCVLRQRADARGLVLRDDVMDFMLARFTRDLGSLAAMLDRLDAYALSTQRAVTIPLIKAMLESD